MPTDSASSLLNGTGTKRKVWVSVIELVFEMDFFKNVRTHCYDTLHLSSQTQHRCRRNTEWLPCLIINSLVDTYMHPCSCFSTPCVWWGLQRQPGHSGQAAASVWPFGASLYKETHQMHIRQQQPAALPPHLQPAHWCLIVEGALLHLREHLLRYSCALNCRG